MSDEQVGLIVRLGRENRRWGCIRVQGELRKLGIRVSASSIRRVLRRHGQGSAPQGGPTWAAFLRSQAQSMLATDFFTVDTLSRKQFYVLFAIEQSTREVHLPCATEHPPTSAIALRRPSLIVQRHDVLGDLIHEYYPVAA